MNEEVFEKAKEEDLTMEEAEELAEFMNENGLADVDEAYEIWSAR